MKQLLDQYFKTIASPVDAEKHYLPLVESGEMDLMAVKKELREIHRFDEADVRITANVLATASMKAHHRNEGFGSSVFGIAIGVLIMFSGIIMTIYLFNKGFIAAVSYIIIAGGATLLVASIRALRKS